MIKKLGSKQKYTLTKRIRKTMAEGFHDGFIWGSMLKRKNKKPIKNKHNVKNDKRNKGRKKKKEKKH